MHAYLIITASDPLPVAQEHALLNLSTQHPDIHRVESEKSIGIDQIRRIKTFLSTPPLKSDHKLVWIPKAHTMTKEAQNAILKSLEEPPSYTQIILASHTTTGLLPTITSRCQVITHLKEPVGKRGEIEKIDKFIKHFPTATTAQKIKLAEKLNKSETPPEEWLKNLLLALREKLKDQPHQNLLNDVQLVSQALNRLQNNANTQLTLEHVFLHLKLS